MVVTPAMQESFDYYPPDINMAGIGLNSTWIPNGINGILIAGRFSPGQAMRWEGDNDGKITRAVTAAGAFAFVCANRRMNLAGTTASQIGFNSEINDYPHVQLKSTDLGVILLLVNNALVASVDPAVAVYLQATWHHLELNGVISTDPDVGWLKFFIDGKQVIDFTGVTCANGAEPTIGRVEVSTSFRSGQCDIDDVIWSTTSDHIGEERIQLLEATSNAAVTWAPLAGANWQEISDASTDGDTSYNTSNTPGQADLFNFADLTNAPSNIIAVSLVMAACKEDAGTRTIKNRLVTPGGTMDGHDQNLSTDYTWVRDLFLLDNGAAWTKANINAMTPGYDLVL